LPTPGREGDADPLGMDRSEIRDLRLLPGQPDGATDRATTSRTLTSVAGKDRHEIDG
jgi:hypothetical protein